MTSQDDSRTFVLVHGAWHAGWCWSAVVGRLTAAGHRAYAPTAPGHAPGQHRSGVSHQDCVDALVGFVEQRDLHEVVLVGHSWGGFMLCGAAPRLAERLRRLVFWNAFVPLAGETMFSLSTEEQVQDYRVDALKTTDGSVPLSWHEWRTGLMQSGSEDAARIIYDMLGTQAFSTFEQPVDVTGFDAISVPSSYINGTEDMTLPPGPGHWVDCHAARLPSPRMIEAQMDHEALFNAPDTLVSALLESSRS